MDTIDPEICSCKVVVKIIVTKLNFKHFDISYNILEYKIQLKLGHRLSIYANDRQCSRLTSHQLRMLTP